MGSIIFLAIIMILVLWILASCIRIVPQAYAIVLERLGDTLFIQECHQILGDVFGNADAHILGQLLHHSPSHIWGSHASYTSKSSMWSLMNTINSHWKSAISLAMMHHDS